MTSSQTEDEESEVCKEIAVDPHPHHDRQEICTTRNKYRRGRRETAVKVFTVAQESKYLLIHNVPDINVNEQLRTLCSLHGEVQLCHTIDYPKSQPFCKVHLVKFLKLGHAIAAKKKLDDYSFMGSILHVCYAPELESIKETKEKLDERRKFVNYRLNAINKKEDNQSTSYNEYVCEQSSSTSPSPSKVNQNEIVDSKTEEKVSIASEKNIKCDEKLTKSNKRTLNESFSETESEQICKKIKKTPKIKWRNK